MNDYQVDIKNLISESDVEQKVIFPLLTFKEPTGLGFDSTEIQTKINLQKVVIDKGSKSVLYYPDYLITVNGIPSLIIEAKKPGEDLEEAFRQAALYAGELNRKFDKGVNPCQLIIACDGLKLLAGTWDAATPQFDIATENWEFTQTDFSNFCIRFSKTSVEKISKDVKSQIRKKVIYKKPLNLLGGKFIQDKPSENSFGENISIQYRHLFNPNIEDERIDVVKNAYVRVSKHESHVSPIDRLIRKKVFASINDSTEIEDNTSPQALIQKLSSAHYYNNQVLLLIGSVGSGKSTFTTYLKEVALDSSIVDKLIWITVDLNNAPVNSEEIYPWLKNRIIKQIQNQFSSIDFDDLDFIQFLYEEQISSLRKGILKLLDPNSDKYKELLVGRVLELQSDLDITLQNYITQLVHKKGKNLIIVLDNCDKRNLEEQLLMFEVANWIKDSIKSIVFLPLRDTTFDHFRREKPLDTVIKDLIFRISPPSLERVLYSRIKYASRLSEKSKDKFYYLPNGIKVNYPAKDELYYLKSILTSLFQNSFFKRLISGLAGSDIRVGLEIFLDFCKSGHIPDQEILKMKQTKGESKLPNHIVSKVFFRGNRVYYTDSAARVKNLFNSDPSDELPNPFIRVNILKWLFDRSKVKGPSGIAGFHLAETLISHLIGIGYEKHRIEKELISLLRYSLIVSESQKTNELDTRELLSINTPGIVHLELIENIEYLSACSEDVWYNIVDVATAISKNMAGEGDFTHLALQSVLENAKLLVDYLETYYNNNFLVYSTYLAEDTFISPIDFESLKDILNKFQRHTRKSDFQEFKIGSILPARIVNIKNYGIIVEIDNTQQTGLIYVKNIKDKDFESEYQVDDEIKVKIIQYREKFGKYDLVIVEDKEIS